MAPTQARRSRSGVSSFSDGCLRRRGSIRQLRPSPAVVRSRWSETAPNVNVSPRRHPTAFRSSGPSNPNQCRTISLAHEQCSCRHVAMKEHRDRSSRRLQQASRLSPAERVECQSSCKTASTGFSCLPETSAPGARRSTACSMTMSPSGWAAEHMPRGQSGSARRKRRESSRRHTLTPAEDRSR